MIPYKLDWNYYMDQYNYNIGDDKYMDNNYIN